MDAGRLVGGNLAGIFRHADIVFANLEGPLYDGDDTTPKNCGQCFSFRSPTYYADVLRSLGVDAVSLAGAERASAFLASSRGEGGETHILIAPGS